MVEDKISQRSHKSKISQKSIQLSQRSKMAPSEKLSSMRENVVPSSRDNAAMKSVRGMYEVRKDNGAAKLNMTDEQWVQNI